MTDPINRPDAEPALPALLSYRDTAPGAFAPPPVAAIAAAGRRRTRRRIAVLATATAVIIAGGAAGAIAGTLGGGPAPDPAPPVQTTPQPDPTPTTPPESSPSPGSPSQGGLGARPAGTRPPAADAITEVDWRSGTVTLPANPDDTCVTGTVQLAPDPQNPDAPTVGHAIAGDLTTKLSSLLVYGDLTGNGRLEGVMLAFCEQGIDSGDGSGQLLLVGVAGDGSRQGLDYLGPVGYNYPSVEIVDGQLVAEVEERYGEQRTQTRAYAWDGESMVQVSGPTAFPVE